MLRGVGWILVHVLVLSYLMIVAPLEYVLRRDHSHTFQCIDFLDTKLPTCVFDKPAQRNL